MGRYILRRLLQFVPVFLGATLLIYTLVFLLPGDPIRALAGEKPMQPGQRDILAARYNLDDPLLVQYGKYLGVVPDAPDRDEPCGGLTIGEACFDGLLQGEFGESLRNRDVERDLRAALPATVRLASVAFTFEVVIGLLAGVVAGLRRGRWLDSLVLVSSLIAVSIPTFVLGAVAQRVIGVDLKLLPVTGTHGGLGYLMPGVVLASAHLAYVARLTRASLVENLRADYVRTATAKGLPRWRIVGVHTMRNSLIPVVTFLGVDLGGLLGGAIVTESIFNIPGIGSAIFRGIQGQDGTLVVGLSTFLVLVYLVVNLLVDLLYAVVDPRIRYE